MSRSMRVRAFWRWIAAAMVVSLGSATSFAQAPAPGATAPPQAALEAAARYSADHGGEALLVLHDGRVIVERYDRAGGPDRPHWLASGSKSFVGLAAVAAAQEGRLRLDDPASEVLEEWRNDPNKARITYRQLLTMTSGLQPGERGGALRAPAWTAMAAAPLIAPPGSRFLYGPFHLNVFALALERKLRPETFEAYLRRRVLDPLGVRVEWRIRCADGHPQVASGAFMTARDWAKVGELVRRRGEWNGRRLFEPRWIDELFRGTDANPAYGLTWWLKRPVAPALVRSVPLLRRLWGPVANAPDLPADLVAAAGAGGQRLYVVPSRRLVVVRFGDLRGEGRGFRDVEFLRLLLGPPTAHP